MAVTAKIGPLVVGPQRLLVSCSDYSYDKIEELRETVGDIRRSRSVFAKHPMNEGETKDAWKERVEPDLEKEAVKKTGESNKDHLRRMFELKSDPHELAPEILEAICKAFGLPAPAVKDLKKCNWLEVKTFIFNVLNQGDIPADDFAPRALANA